MLYDCIKKWIKYNLSIIHEYTTEIKINNLYSWMNMPRMNWYIYKIIFINNINFLYNHEFIEHSNDK